MQADTAVAAQQSAKLTAAESRALDLLGQGLIPEQVAGACGLSASRISQLLSNEEFASAVAELRFQNLSRHNERDNAYDLLEDELIERMRDCLPLMVRPHEILKAIQVINGAKRRGQQAAAAQEHHTVINLVLPTQLLTNFQLNTNNQVVQAGDQPLVTIQSGSLLAQIKEKRNVLTQQPAISSSAKRQLTAEDF